MRERNDCSLIKQIIKLRLDDYIHRVACVLQIGGDAVDDGCLSLCVRNLFDYRTLPAVRECTDGVKSIFSRYRVGS
jgi:hypothetical protein